MAAKGTSPLLGYNTNIRHKGVLCHVQTEDSGVLHPHVITHLFTAGTIIATRKRSYKEHLEVAELEPIVRKLMQEQHKAMCISLRDGEFDGTLPIRDTVKIDAASLPIAVEPVVASPPPPPPPPAATSKSEPARKPAPPPVRAVKAPKAAPAAAPIEVAEAAQTAPPPTVRSKPVPPVETTYQTKSDEVVHTPLPRVRSAAATPAPPTRRAATPPPDPDAGRYSSKNPALFSGAKKPPLPPSAAPKEPVRRAPASSTIFGQEYISEKSLDEVILAYLSEEVDEK